MVDEIPSCGQLVTFNNTYWQSPNKINSESSCSLTVKLDEYLVEQSKPICQLRLKKNFDYLIGYVIYIILIDFLSV